MSVVLPLLPATGANTPFPMRLHVEGYGNARSIVDVSASSVPLIPYAMSINATGVRPTRVSVWGGARMQLGGTGAVLCSYCCRAHAVAKHAC
jgi:hypothetical protein